jgi:hypothetical protein
MLSLRYMTGSFLWGCDMRQKWAALSHPPRVYFVIALVTVVFIALALWYAEASSAYQFSQSVIPQCQANPDFPSCASPTP